MPILSAEMLRDMFRRTVMKALQNCKEIHPGGYARRCRSLAGAPWIEIGPTIQAIQVDEAEFLIRASWQFTIDLRTNDQQKTAQAQVNEIASALASTIPHGESVKGTFVFPPTETSAGGEKVTGSFRGVVCGQVQCGVPA